MNILHSERLVPDYNSRVTLTVLFFAVIVLLSYLFYPLFINLLHAWDSNPQFSHGYLIPCIAIYMVWHQRNRLINLIKDNGLENVRYLNIDFVIAFLGLFLFIVAKYTSLVLIEGISFIIILLAFVLFVYGIDVFKVALFPILYLFFMLPIPSRIIDLFSIPLQSLVAKLSAWIVSLFGIPVFLESEFIYLSTITLQVTEACSGLRSLLAFVAIGALFAYLYIRSNLLRVSILVLSIVVAIVMNLIRVSAIGILAYYIDNETGLKVHEYGWTFISLFGYSLIFLIGTTFIWIESRKG